MDQPNNITQDRQIPASYWHFPTPPAEGAVAALMQADPDLGDWLAVCRAREQEDSINAAGMNRVAQGDDQTLFYHGLIKAICGQQVHAKLARKHFFALCGLNNTDCGMFAPPKPEALLTLADQDLRKLGFTGAKITALREVAKAQLAGEFPVKSEALALSAESLEKRLTRLKGIGKWSVELALIFALGHPDVFPAGDKAVREGWRKIHREKRQLSEAALRAEAEKFAPHRTLLARYCWEANRKLPNIG